jgi:hypothetical protein
MMEECQILFYLQETDPEVREAMLEEEQECGLHPYNRRDLLVELEGIHVHVDEIGGEHAVEGGRLLRLVV